MSKEGRDKLFLNFSKLDNSQNLTGTGLGLSICKQLIEKMGGVVKVKSKIGEGTVFMIELAALCKVECAKSLSSLENDLPDPYGGMQDLRQTNDSK